MEQTVTISEQDAKVILEVMRTHCHSDGTQDAEQERVKYVLSEAMDRLKGERVSDAFRAWMVNGRDGLSMVSIPLDARRELEALRKREVEIFASCIP